MELKSPSAIQQGSEDYYVTHKSKSDFHSAESWDGFQNLLLNRY